LYPDINRKPKLGDKLNKPAIITLRSCITRYGYHIEAFNDKAPEMIRFSKDDLKANVEYEVESPSFRLMGNLQYDFHNKEKFVKN
jgi:hypothetical protein